MSTVVSNDARPKSPLGELLALAAPTVAQSVSYTIMQFIDTAMLSRLGTEAPTAAGNAGIFAFAVICFGFGVMLVVNTLVSQSFGRNELDHCGPYLWQGYWVGLLYALLVLPLIGVAQQVFGFFGHTESLAALEAKYLGIVLLGTFVKMVSTASGQFLLATNRPMMVLISAVCGVSVNAVVAYAIVLGNFGFKQYGVVGAAWAQNIGVAVEMLVVLAFVFGNQPHRFNVFDWRPRLQQAITLVRVGAGAGLQIVADVLAWALFLVAVMAQLGENAMAANQFMFRYMVVSFMPAMGISQAVTALVGRSIGRGEFAQAIRRADLGFALAAVYMFSCGVLMAIFRYPLIRVFTNDPQVIQLGATLLIFAGVYQFFDAMYLIYIGALRGAGDTLIPGLATAGLCWSITVGGGFMIARYFPQFGVAGPWSACTLYGIVLGIFMLTRFRRGRWKSIQLEAPATSNLGADSARLTPLTEIGKP